ncbi:MAG: methyltransferase domain-containing protein [Roseiarcus sp.]|jgi:S-adenosylmethionine-diacylgycerolhomoserine-N-methlytransferase
MSEAAVLMDRMYRRQRHIYDATRKFYLIGRDAMIAELDARPGDGVLEIGCGTGRNLVKLARRFPEARLFGLDVSNEMLTTARAAIARARMEARIRLAQGDAASFDAAQLFGRPHFERVIISYALSMIPPWREALGRAVDALAPGGSLHIVDFGDSEGLPAPFRAALNRWLAVFDVTPRVTLRAELEALARSRGVRCETRNRLRGYAIQAVIRKPAA